MQKSISVFLFKKSQTEIINKIQLSQTLNPLNDVSAVSSIENTSNLKDVFRKS